MPFAARRSRLPRAWAPLVAVALALAGCTVSFDPATRPRRDGAGADILTSDSPNAEASAESGVDGGPDVVIVPDGDVAVFPDADAGDVTSPLDADVLVTDVVGDADVIAPDAPDAGDGANPIDAGCGPCNAGEGCCDGVCTNLATAANCGACGIVCPGTLCVGGACSATCALGFADCDHNAVNGCEQNLATSATNCGSCGVACPAGRPCVGGTCACPAGTADCDNNPANGCEVNTDTDSTSCGACGNACKTNQSCAAGVCECATGFGDCDSNTGNGCETDLTTSASNCGACRSPCGLNSSCVAGVCQCGAGQQRCPPSSADCNTSTSDPNNCGGCGITCGAGLVCTSAGCGSGCGANETLCGTSCVDQNTDLGNCGDCGNVCPVPANASALCRGGVCGFTCNAGFADCNGAPDDGCETGVGSDATNCGSCGNACSAGHQCVAGACVCPGGQRDCNGVCAECCNDAQCPPLPGCMANHCVAGTCQASSNCALNCCPGSVCRGCCNDAQCAGAGPNRGCGTDGTCSVCLAGYGDCDGDPANGCESVLATSVRNCGACGNACQYPNASPMCTAGVCARGACNPGFADCDGNPVNGCEINLNTDPTHCGSCTNVCNVAGANNICAMGTCAVSSCAPGLGNCDTSNPDCETDVNSSLANCGACGSACSYAHASAACATGMCVFVGCSAGYGNCDAQTGNGCEVDLSTSVANCGGCGRACNLPNAMAGCSAGGCTIVACAPGFGDCDGMASNGCETDLRTTLSHCGTCATSCSAGANAQATCTSGSCGFTCATGFADCDAMASNGCEADLVNSPSHCGSCSTTCQYAHAAPVCSGASCSMGACEPGFSDCDMNASNGCETNTASSTSNCGRCGTTCVEANATPACSGGMCAVLSCNSGYRDCNSSPTDGCEIECGAGRLCGTGALGGLCAPGWLTMSTAGAPSARAFPFYAVAYNRHEVFVWGGVGANGSFLSDGARYNWDTDTWTALPPVMGSASLSGRAYGRGVWTGSEFVIWGGQDANGVTNTGARFQPGVGWRLMTRSSAPAGRVGYHAGLTADGTHVLYQGGQDTNGARNDGALYDLVADSWSSIATANSNPHDEWVLVQGRYLATFGGSNGVNCALAAAAAPKVLDLQTGAGGTWTTAPPSTSTPSNRWFAPQGACAPESLLGPIDLAGDMFIWGGVTNATLSTTSVASGALWHLSDLSFRTINGTPPAPMSSGAYLPVLVSTGNTFLGWSPVTNGPTPNNLVWSYDPATDTFAALPSSGGPPPIIDGAVYAWTGSELLVWGGKTGTAASTAIATGGRYAP